MALSYHLSEPATVGKRNKTTQFAKFRRAVIHRTAQWKNIRLKSQGDNCECNSSAPTKPREIDIEAEVEAHPGDGRYCTAVGQVLAFTLLAMGAQPHGQSERCRAMDRLRTWAEDCEAILRRIPASEQKQTPPPSALVAKIYSS